jgi:type IV pilus assembly protein PilE
MNESKRMQQHRGFTLIELMITVAIIGILAAVAMPSYTAYIQRGWRADARAVLLENAQYMARVYSEDLSYKKDGTTPTLPVTQAPSSGAANYNITVTAVEASSTVVTSYTLTATPTGWTDSQCGNLTIDQTSVKGASVPTSDEGDADCWLR